MKWKLIFAAIVCLSTASTVFGQAGQYGTIAVASYSSTESTNTISVQFATGVLEALRKQDKVKPIGEVHVLRRRPTNATIAETFSEGNASTVAVILTELGDDKQATFSIEVYLRGERGGFTSTVATVGRVIAERIGVLSHNIANTLISFASRFKEVHVVLYVLTIPPQSQISVAGSDMITSGADGIGVYDGTRPVGKTTVSVAKMGFHNGAFDFEVPVNFRGNFLRIDKSVQLTPATTP